MPTPANTQFQIHPPGVGGSAHSKLKPGTQLVVPTHICPNCGTASAAQAMPGSTTMEVVLWLTTFIFGLIYSVWRRSKKSMVCPSCGNKQIVHLNTPAGKRLSAMHYPDGIDPEVVGAPEPKKTSPIVAVGLVFFLLFFLYSLPR